VTCVAMSAAAATHCLVAIACDGPLLQLGDLRSGAITHTVDGHRDAVRCAAWSLRSEFELVSGDAGGRVHVWDVRRSGCVCSLDMWVCFAWRCGEFGIVLRVEVWSVLKVWAMWRYGACEGIEVWDGQIDGRWVERQLTHATNECICCRSQG